MTIYLDWNATAPLREEARRAWLKAQDGTWGNPSSVHRHGQRARVAWDAGLARCAALLGCRAGELVATSGGSEANALAIHSALAHGGVGVVVASAVEHSSVLRNVLLRDEAELRTVGVGGDGRVDPGRVAAAVDGRVRLVCVQLANNETGVIQDVAAIARAVRAANPATLVLADCCQAVGKMRVALDALEADLASVAGHKFGAPRGVGLLWVRPRLPVAPMIAGGRQQDGRRSGTQDVAALCALAAALEAACAALPDEEARQRRLLEDCFAAIRDELPDAQWIAEDAPRLANTLSLGHPGVDAEILVPRLDLAGFALSRGAACMAASGGPSHVVAALGLCEEMRRGVVRVSIGHLTTAEELSSFAAAYVAAVRELLAQASTRA